MRNELFPIFVKEKLKGKKDFEIGQILTLPIFGKSTKFEVMAIWDVKSQKIEGDTSGYKFVSSSEIKFVLEENSKEKNSISEKLTSSSKCWVKEVPQDLRDASNFHEFGFCSEIHNSELAILKSLINYSISPSIPISLKFKGIELKGAASSGKTTLMINLKQFLVPDPSTEVLYLDTKGRELKGIFSLLKEQIMSFCLERRKKIGWRYSKCL